MRFFNTEGPNRPDRHYSLSPLQPMLAGSALAGVPEDDIQYLIDLGLCRMAAGQGLTIANPSWIAINSTWRKIPAVIADWAASTFTTHRSQPHDRCASD